MTKLESSYATVLDGRGMMPDGMRLCMRALGLRATEIVWGLPASPTEEGIEARLTLLAFAETQPADMRP